MNVADLTRRVCLPAACLALLTAGSSLAQADTTGSLLPAPAASAGFAQLAQAVGGRGATQTPHFAYLHKIDGRLQDVAVSRLGSGGAAAASAAARRQGVAASQQGDVSVDVYVNGDVGRAAGELRALGMRVTAIGERAPQRLVEGFLPPEALAEAAALAATRAIVAPIARFDTGSVTSEGDAAIHGPQARALGASGAGVFVGVISDSIDEVGAGVSGSQATGDLPASVVNLFDMPGGTDEGRAMAEIVYDEAPGIGGIVFASAAGGPATKANSIDNLVSHGVKVIADDTSYITEPFFQDGVVSQAVDRARAAGVAYFIAAGNDGNQSWEGDYSGGATQDFAPGAAVDTVQTVGTLDNGDTAVLVLQWAEPWGRATTDFAIDVYEIVGGVANFAFTAPGSNSIATGLPEEIAVVSATGGSATFGIAIRRMGGTASPFMKYIDFTNGAGTVAIEHATNSGAVAPDAASARGALTVAASPFATPAIPEPFSARGPVTRRFDVAGTLLTPPDVRQKPNLAGPDRVSTSVAGFAPFAGTSAAAPAAAGIAALMLSAKPGLGIEELSAIMTEPANALDCPAAGNPDSECGAGFLLADRALAMALDSTPPAIAPTVSPATPDGANGWYRGPVSVSWAVSDPQSPVTGPLGCSAASPGEGTTSLICSATSAGGTASVPVTIRRDSSPPSLPVLSGIAAKTYGPASVPPASSIACQASDPTSGIAACAVTGSPAGARPGAHTLTAVATNGAGLASTTTLIYTVAKPLAIARLAVAKGLTLATVARSGIPVTLRIATAATRVVVKLVALIPNAPGTRTVALVRFTKRVPAGTAKLRITLTATAKRQLRNVSRATLKITISGSSKAARNATLQRSLSVPGAKQ